MSKKNTPTEPTEVVINDCGVITAGFETIEVPTQVKGITVTIHVAEYEELWYAGYTLRRSGSGEGAGSRGKPIFVGEDRILSHHTYNDAVDAMLQEAITWMQQSIIAYPNGPFTTQNRKALKAVEEYREALIGKKTPPAAGWTCPDCGLLVAADFAECTCGTTYDGPMDAEETTPETPALEVLAPEVLPPEKSLARQKATAVAFCGIEHITESIRANMTEIRKLEDDALNCAIRIGILQEMAKRVIPHGEFNAWREREFGKSLTTLKYYHVLALKRLAEVGLMQGTGKHTPMQLPMPADLSALDDETLIPEKYRQTIFDWGDDRPQSIRDALDRYGVKVDAKPRGGDHGGGKAMHDLAKSQRINEMMYAQEQWRHIIEQFREFALKRKGFVHVPPDVLDSGLESVRECIRALPKKGN